jgi:hypothetical protein
MDPFAYKLPAEPAGNGFGGQDSAGRCLDQSPRDAGAVTDGKQIFDLSFELC